MTDVLVRNPSQHDLVLSGFCSLAPGEKRRIPDHIAGRYLASIQIVHQVTDTGAKALNFTSTLHTSSGYGLGSANLILELARRGYAVHFSGDPSSAQDSATRGIARAQVDPLPKVGLIRWVPDLFKFNLSQARIGWTMWDTPRLPSWWEPLIRTVDHLIVPSQGQIDIFRDSGVTTPMTAVPEPLLLDKYPYVDRPELDTFTFVSLARMCSRKCPIETVECFQRAFPTERDVRLVMKTIGGQFGMGRLGIPNIDDSRITIIDENWSHDQIVALLHSADAGVFLSRGEGFLHGCAQAMATGLPTIVPSHSGCAAYANDKYNYPIRFVGTVPTDYYVGHIGTQEPFEWWESDWDQVVETMRAIYRDREKARAKGKRAAPWIRKKFDFAETISKVERVLEPFL